VTAPHAAPMWLMAALLVAGRWPARRLKPG